MEHQVRRYVCLSDLLLEMWLEIIHHANWSVAMSMVMLCKYTYNSLSKYLKHPQIQVDFFDSSRFRPPDTTILIKNGRIYMHRFFQRRDSIVPSIAQLFDFLADLKRAESSFGHTPNIFSDERAYRYIIDDTEGRRLCYGKPAAARVFKTVVAFVLPINYSIPRKEPGVVIISIGEKNSKEKCSPGYVKRRKIYRTLFEIKFVLDAEGNLEWSMPSYDFRTIYAKKVYEDLKNDITSDKAHLKPLEIPQYDFDEVYGCIYSATYFKAKFIDNFGKKYKLHRYILHEDNKRIHDIQNYKEKTFTSILKTMDRVLDQGNLYSKTCLSSLCCARGRQTLPWSQLFRPPADLPYDTSNFLHNWRAW